MNSKRKVVLFREKRNEPLKNLRTIQLHFSAKLRKFGPQSDFTDSIFLNGYNKQMLFFDKINHENETIIL